MPPSFVPIKNICREETAKRDGPPAESGGQPTAQPGPGPQRPAGAARPGQSADRLAKKTAPGGACNARASAGVAVGAAALDCMQAHTMRRCARRRTFAMSDIIPGTAAPHC